MKYLAPAAALIVLIFVVAFYDEMRVLLLYAGLGLLAFAGVVGVIAAVIGAGMGWEKWGTVRAERKGVEAETRRKEAEADKAQHEAGIVVSGGDAWVREIIKYIENGIEQTRTEYARLGGTRLRVNSHDHIPTESERLFASTLLTTGQTKMMTSGQILPQIAAPVDLLAQLDRAERVLVKGASDAGKTTLLQHVASRSSGVFIIDPHFAPGIWPVKDNRVIGAARNYPAIDTFLLQLLEEVNSRYARRAKGEMNFGQITLIIDEFQSIRAECDQAGKILSTLIRESRKVGFRLFIGSHSELVKPLGLEGQGDIRDGLLIVRLEIDQITKQRKVTMDAGHGEQDCYFPPFGQPAQLPAPAAMPDLVIRPTKEEQHLIELIQVGITSRKQLSESVWGKGKFGKFYNEKIDKILAKYGIVVELG